MTQELSQTRAASFKLPGRLMQHFLVAWMRPTRRLLVLGRYRWPLAFATIALLATTSARHVGSAARGLPHDWSPKPSLTLDLVTLGYTPRVVKNTLSNREFFSRFDPSVDPSILQDYYPTPVFVDDNVIAVHWVRPEYADPKDEQDARAIPKGVRLIVLLLDSTSGKLIARREFPTVFRKSFTWDTQSRLASLGNGRFLIHAGNHLMLFSREFQLLRQRDLPTEAGTGNSGTFIVVPGGPRNGSPEAWAMFVAPRGKTLLLQHTLDGHYLLEWLNPDDLKTVATREAPTGLTAVSDNIVTYGWYRSIQALSREGSPNQVCSPGPPCEGGMPWAFLQGEQLLIPRQRSLSVLSLRGQVLWSKEGDIRGNGICYLQTSLEGNRFLISVQTERDGYMGEAKLQQGVNALLYDASTRTVVFQVHSGKDVGRPALSANGRRLAFLPDANLLLYDLSASE